MKSRWELLPVVDCPPVEWNPVFVGALFFNILPANALAWPQLGERSTPIETVGMLLILTALAVLSIRGLLRWQAAPRNS